jgi:hypothetical protein
MDADGDFVVTWAGGGQDGSAAGVYARRYVSAQPPATIGIAPVTVQEDAPDTVLSLWDTFDDFNDHDGTLAFNIVGNTNTGLLGSISISNLAGTLTLNYAPVRGGQATLTVRATDPGGLFTETVVLVTIGPEFRANTVTPFDQRAPSVARDADGDFVIAWQGDAQDGSGVGVFAQRYNAAGVPQGGEFLVNTTTLGDQVDPAVAMDADGDFVIAWSGFGTGEPGSQVDDVVGVFARRYSAAGAPQGAEFLVNMTTMAVQVTPAVAMDADGDFVVAWAGEGPGDAFGIFARRYAAAAGAARGDEFRVNTTTADVQMTPAVAMDAGGGFVVAWSGNGIGDPSGVFFQRYDSEGVDQGGETRVHVATADGEVSPGVGMDADGDFLVTWSNPQQGSILARRYNAVGVAQGGEFAVSAGGTGGAGARSSPAVAMDADGDFIVAWQGRGREGSGDDVFYRRFNAAGVAQGGEFPVNVFAGGDQRVPALAVDPDGDFVAAWESHDQDASGFGVYARRFEGPAAAPRVTAVFADSSAWTSPFRAHLQDTGFGGVLGFLLPGGLDQFKSLPFNNVNRIVVQFSKHVSVQQADLSVRGVGVANYATSAFSYDPATFTATWTLAQMVGRDKLRLDLDADAATGGVTDGTRLLDGEWADGGDAFPSGDGTAGGDFRLRLNVAPGDADGTATVNVTDLGLLSTNFNRSPRSPRQGDFNGDARVDVTDLGVLATNFNRSLPAGNPALVAPSTAAAKSPAARNVGRRPATTPWSAPPVSPSAATGIRRDRPLSDLEAVLR